MSKKTSTQKHKSREKGLSLIESAMVLALSAVVIAAVLYFYNNSIENKKVNDGISRLQTIIAATNGFIASNASAFDGNIGNFIKAVSLKTGIPTINQGDGTTQLVDENGRGIQIWAVSSSRYYVIEVQTSNIPTCVKYASMNMGTMYYQKPDIYLGSNKIGTANDVSSANTACQKADQQRKDANIKIRYSLKY
ncbi:PilW family protein [Escherichia coli]|uniref:PilW family protein n=1 Tax=Escherichia coli TaxID=562 RepID=UPI00069A2C48|nr:hypothetical protein [Escherichia coli]EFA9671500.1 hypothetical protein [Escherichia coli]EFC8022761.1 hypothetical protein [Escherichia coli]EFK3793393.1 hypothetical protein [Escherichia coli]EGM3942914.1 hypothetical protein [Escherichia coli]EHY2738128.1 hypothetical protein [Escherichia coli]